MTLRHGRPAVSIPGPSVIPDRVLAAMHRPMPNIYEGELVDVAMSVLADLPSIARTTTAEPFIVIGNGHAAWQMAIDNTLNRGDKVLVLESGTFAVAWGDMASVSGIDVEVLPGTDHTPVDPVAVGDRLARDADHEIAAIFVVLADTASSCLNDIAAIRAAIDDAGHPALLMVDAIASLGCDRFEMDAWGVDLTVAASQKGLMVPPGIAMVWAGERAIEAYDRGTDLRSGYSDWGPRMRPEAFYQRFAGTPPISHVYGMREALDMIDEEGGLDAVWARHEVLATAIWDAIDAWSTEGGLTANIAERATGHGRRRPSAPGRSTRTNSVDAPRPRSDSPSVSASGRTEITASASATWVTSTRRCCSAPSAPSRRRSRRWDSTCHGPALQRERSRSDEQRRDASAQRPLGLSGEPLPGRPHAVAWGATVRP